MAVSVHAIVHMVRGMILAVRMGMRHETGPSL
jgi:hypothetical protein